MKLARIFLSIFCTATFAFSALAVEPEPEVVRPTGVEKRPAKESAPKESESKESASKERASKPKPKRARSTKKKDDEDDVPIVTSAPGSSVPATGARSVMMIDAHNGQILYEKNADEVRPAASTQKLLTALIVDRKSVV